MSTESIIEQVKILDTKLVEVTGGEPLAQPEVHQLMSQLCDLGLKCFLKPAVRSTLHRLIRGGHHSGCQVPGSNEASANDLGNLDKLRPSTELNS